MDYPVLPDTPAAIADLTPEMICAAVVRDQPCHICKGEGRVSATERVAVLQDGRRIGTVPPEFDPSTIRSMSFFYDVRPGDFRRDGDVWVAHTMLGAGDLEAVPGFVWDRC